MSLISLANYKAYKGVSSTSKDVEHQLYLDMATEQIQSYCGRNFVSGAPITETFDGDSSFYYLREYPVQSVLSFTVDGTASTSYNIDLQNGYIEQSDRTSFTTAAFQAVKVQYIGGYSTIPSDLQQVCAKLSDYYLEKEYAPRRGTGVHSIDQVNESDRFPYYIKGVLDYYRVSV